MQLPNYMESKKRGQSKVNVIREEYDFDKSRKEIGQDKKYYIKTYGCQMNIRDTEKLKAILEGMGFIERIDGRC